MKKISSLCVFCGSSTRVGESHRAAAQRLGKIITGRGIRLVYGGGRVGLMGILADAVLEGGGKVVGVIPEFLIQLELAHPSLTELRIVDTMHERKRLMSDLADGFIVLSGGFGTLDETFEILSWKQLGLHGKPVVFLSVEGFWEPFRALVDGLVREGFARPEHKNLFTLVSSVEEVFDALAATPEPLIPAETKWT